MTSIRRRARLRIQHAIVRFFAKLRAPSAREYTAGPAGNGFARFMREYEARNKIREALSVKH